MLLEPRERHSLLRVLLDLDRRFVAELDHTDARKAVRAYAGKLAICKPLIGEEREQCLVDSLLAKGGLLAPLESPNAPPHAHTATHALTAGRGSCASLVAVVLAVTEDLGRPFDALVLRDHVLLGSASSPIRFYEVLESGRRIRLPLSMYRRAGPSGPIRATGRDYLAHYLDSIAARLANAGRAPEAERAFGYATSLRPSDTRLKYNFGSFLVDHERYEEAVALLSDAIQGGWRDSEAFVNRGVAYWRLAQFDSARRDFEMALRLDPTNSEASANLRQLRKTAASSTPDR